MTDTVLMYDSTEPGAVARIDAVKAGTAAAAGYCDADFAQDWITMVHDLPHLAAKAWIVSIGTRNGTVCRIFDKEPGNPLDPAQVAANVVAMVKRGVYRPGGYADGSDMPGLKQALARTSLKRQEYVLLLADPTAQRPTAEQLRAQDLDGIQYAWASKGQAPAGTDISCVLPDFLPPAKPDPKPVKPHGLAHAAVEVNLATGRARVRAEHGTAHFGPDDKALQHSFRIELHKPAGKHDGRWNIHRLG